MGILDWISQSAKKLKDVESQIDKDSRDVYEIYQRNVALYIRTPTICTQCIHIDNKVLSFQYTRYYIRYTNIST